MKKKRLIAGPAYKFETKRDMQALFQALSFETALCNNTAYKKVNKLSVNYEIEVRHGKLFKIR